MPPSHVRPDLRARAANSDLPPHRSHRQAPRGSMGCCCCSVARFLRRCPSTGHRAGTSAVTAHSFGWRLRLPLAWRARCRPGSSLATGSDRPGARVAIHPPAWLTWLPASTLLHFHCRSEAPKTLPHVQRNEWAEPHKPSRKCLATQSQAPSCMGACVSRVQSRTESPHRNQWQPPATVTPHSLTPRVFGNGGLLE